MLFYSSQQDDSKVSVDYKRPSIAGIILKKMDKVRVPNFKLTVRP